MYPQKKMTDEGILKKLKDDKTVAKKQSDSDNTFENITYTGFDQKGNPFKIQSEYAEITENDPSLTKMQNVTAYFYYKNNRIIIITSKEVIVAFVSK